MAAPGAWAMPLAIPWPTVAVQLPMTGAPAAGTLRAGETVVKAATPLLQATAAPLLG